MNRLNISLYELILCLSNTQDLILPQLARHHQQVAYLAFRLAQQINLPFPEQKEIFLASLMHDIGALSAEEKLELIENEPITVNSHAFKGAKLIEGFWPLKKEANVIKYHHVPWENGLGKKFQGNDVPFASHIIHLADRTCTKLNTSINVLSQIPNVLSQINKQSGLIFEPNLVKALYELSQKEYIWLDIISNSPVDKLPKNLYDTLILDIDDIIDFSAIFSQIIDFKSRFTASHSAGVAKTAEKLAELLGFSNYECKMMLISGYLHDLGKVAISNSILEKQGSLTQEELNEIHTHTYHTYQLLATIPEFKTINIWASYHHERLDGKGYPFHIKGDELPLGSRILAAADVFTAITEDRPYRGAMSRDKAIQVLNNMVKNLVLDKNVVEILINNFGDINEIRAKAQYEAVSRYSNFMKMH